MWDFLGYPRAMATWQPVLIVDLLLSFRLLSVLLFDQKNWLWPPHEFMHGTPLTTLELVCFSFREENKKKEQKKGQKTQ